MYCSGGIIICTRRNVGNVKARVCRKMKNEKRGGSCSGDKMRKKNEVGDAVVAW